MTPWQLRQCAEESVEDAFDRHDSNAWFMYHVAALFRVKKLPDLKLFLAKRGQKTDGDKKATSGINEEAIMAWLQSADAANKEKRKKEQ